MNRKFKLTLIGLGIAVTGLSAFVFWKLREAPAEWSFLYQLDDSPRLVNIDIYDAPRGKSGSRFGVLDKPIVMFDIRQPVDKVNEQIRTKLQGEEWKEQKSANGKQTIFRKTLPNSTGFIKITSEESSKFFTLVKVQDDSPMQPKWVTDINSKFN